MGWIDYSFLGVAPQVWEINANSTVARRPSDHAGEHRPGHKLCIQRLSSALDAVELELYPGTGFSVTIDLPYYCSLRGRLKVQSPPAVFVVHTTG